MVTVHFTVDCVVAFDVVSAVVSAFFVEFFSAFFVLVAFVVLFFADEDVAADEAELVFDDKPFVSSAFCDKDGSSVFSDAVASADSDAVICGFVLCVLRQAMQKSDIKQSRTHKAAVIFLFIYFSF